LASRSCVSALTVHFRDVRDLLANLLTLWFFATPIIYPLAQAPERVRRLLNLNPFTQLAIAYQEVLFRPGPFSQVTRLFAVAVASVVIFYSVTSCSTASGTRFRRKCEQSEKRVGRGGERTDVAIQVRDVHKIYRRYSRRKQFRDVEKRVPLWKCAEGLASRCGAGSIERRLVRRRKRDNVRHRRSERVGQEHDAQADCRDRQTDHGSGFALTGRVSALIELGAGFHPEISGRENVYINGPYARPQSPRSRRRFDEIVRFAELDDSSTRR
jgi:hypothetical protein